MMQRTFNRGWFVTYSILCATLMMGSSVSGQLSDWTAEVVGGADCNAQANLSQLTCAGCDKETYSKCNQQSGNATTICQTGAGGNACTASTRCTGGEMNDTLDPNGADGQPCTPKQI